MEEQASVVAGATLERLVSSPIAVETGEWRGEERTKKEKRIVQTPSETECKKRQNNVSDDPKL